MTGPWQVWLNSGLTLAASWVAAIYAKPFGYGLIAQWFQKPQAASTAAWNLGFAGRIQWGDI